MNWVHRNFSLYLAACRALPKVFGFLVVFASVIPTLPSPVEHFRSDHAQVVATGNDTVPAGEAVQGDMSHAICCPGIGCSAFVAPAEASFAASPPGRAIERIDIAKLPTRNIAPSLAPPKIITLV